MPLRAILIATIVTLGLGLSPLAAKDWIFDDGAYTVDPKTGKRDRPVPKEGRADRRSLRPVLLAQRCRRLHPLWLLPRKSGDRFRLWRYAGGYGGGYGYGYGGYGFGSGYPAFGGYAF